MNMTQLIAIGLPTGSEWLIILVVILLFFGGAKIPQLMRGLGKGVGEFQAGMTQGKRALKTAMDEAAAEEEAQAKTGEKPA
jgi:sec-independent protein translocase protein TatA